uniref:Uncharacterized protein n=1 Tax=Arundo donax TaxID=35708 RepID=A0A0A9BFR4_ARUDO
MVGSPFLS